MSSALKIPRIAIVVPVLALACVSPWFPAARADDDAAHLREQAFEQRIRPVLTKYCFDCHAGDGAEAEVHLDRYENVEQMHHARPAWLRVRDKVVSGEMPPEEAEQPSAEDRKLLADAIDEVLSRIDCDKEARPGRVTIRRLNRVEYRHTVRDLLGVDYEPADDFPADDVGYGFDNIADVLSLPPILLEKYLAAAEEISDKSEVLRLAQVDKEDGARAFLRQLATRAYRRPVRNREFERLFEFARSESTRGKDWQAGIRLAAQALLVSPHFLFRIERDPPQGLRERDLDDYELASRLSYFLWSTMPDDELFRLADEGSLREEPTLRRQVQRMLASPRSTALADNFAAQWLELRKFAEVKVSEQDFPEFDEGLRADMRRETTALFEHIARENRSVMELLAADYSFLNARLARHYGIPDVEGEQLRLVSLVGTSRRGVLTHGSVLTVTSNPTRTSPVKRGKWILENLLGEPPPPPPPNVPELEETGAVLQGTLRERMEQHRRDPACASCHRTMDALGFALENYNATGAWREEDGGFPIDATGELPSGESFSGAGELIDQLANSRKQQFLRCFTEKLLTYALGRGLEYYDACAVDKIVAQLNEHDDRFTTLVWQIACSDPFRKRESALNTASD